MKQRRLCLFNAAFLNSFFITSDVLCHLRMPVFSCLLFGKIVYFPTLKQNVFLLALDYNYAAMYHYQYQCVFSCLELCRLQQITDNLLTVVKMQDNCTFLFTHVTYSHRVSHFALPSEQFEARHAGHCFFCHVSHGIKEDESVLQCTLPQ